MSNSYVAPYEIGANLRPSIALSEGQFTLPICFTPERFDKFINALFYYGQHQREFDLDHLVDTIAALPNVVEGCIDYGDQCRELSLNDDRISWFPENPFTPESEPPSGYPFHPFTVVSPDNLGSIITAWGLGFKVGDVFVDLTKLPAFSSWLDIASNYANMPRIQVNNLVGRGKVTFTLLNIIQGSRMLVVVDDVVDVLNLRTIEVGRDAISFPPETNVDFSVEVEVTTDGTHTVALVIYPTVDVSAIPISFGGGFRTVELCGFGEFGMDDPCCPDSIEQQEKTNELLSKIISMMQGGMTADIRFSGSVSVPDEAGGDCAPTHFDHDDGEELPSEIQRRYKALCLTVNQYVKALLLKTLRDMNSPQALIDFVDGKFPDVTVPLSLSNLTVIYPSTFTSINVFFDALTDNIDLNEVACAMLDGLTGEKNNTSSNFRDALDGYTTEALMQSFVDLVHASNANSQNYKDFNTTLNANNTASVDDYDCPCGAPPPDGECGGFIPVDWNGSGTTFEYMGDCVWKINSGSGSPYNSSVKDLFDRPFYITNPEPELGFPPPGCSNTEQIGANGCPDKIGGCNFSTGLWDGCYSTIQWDSGTPNYYKFHLCTEIDECP